MDKKLFSSKIEYMLEKLIKGEVIITSIDKDRGASGMTVAWGFFGNMWNEAFFIAAVRPYRYTLNAIRDSSSFSVNFFDKGFQADLKYFGTVSGYDEDKFKNGSLHFSQTSGKFATIDEASIILNCSVVTTNQIEPFNLERDYIKRHYQSDNGYHVMIYGRIEEIKVRDHLKL